MLSELNSDQLMRGPPHCDHRGHSGTKIMNIILSFRVTGSVSILIQRRIYRSTQIAISGYEGLSSYSLSAKSSLGRWTGYDRTRTPELLMRQSTDLKSSAQSLRLALTVPITGVTCFILAHHLLWSVHKSVNPSAAPSLVARLSACP